MADTPSPLQRTASEFPTEYWNDSCNESELRYAMENGAVGATTNPTIVGTVMEQEYEIWAPRVREIIAAHPTWTDQQVTWQVIEEMAVRGWKMLEPIYEASHGQKGRLSIQTNPTLAPSAEKMAEQARHFETLAPTCRSSSPRPGPASKPWRRSPRRASPSTPPSPSRCPRPSRSGRPWSERCGSARLRATTPRGWRRCAPSWSAAPMTG